MLQVAALMVFAFFFIALLANGELLKYRSIYQEIELDPAEAEAKCTSELDVCAFIAEYHEHDPAKELQRCIDCETKPLLVGKELVGVNSTKLTSVLIWFTLAFTMPFAVVRVPTWLWEGWRKSR